MRPAGFFARRYHQPERCFDRSLVGLRRAAVSAGVARDPHVTADEITEDLATAQQVGRLGHAGARLQQRARAAQFERLEGHGCQRAVLRRAQLAQLLLACPAHRDDVFGDRADQITQHDARGLRLFRHAGAPHRGRGPRRRVARRRQLVHLERQPRHCRQDAGGRKLDAFLGWNPENETGAARGARADRRSGARVQRRFRRRHRRLRWLVGILLVDEALDARLAFVHRFLADVLECVFHDQAGRVLSRDRPQMRALVSVTDQLAAHRVDRQRYEVGGANDVDVNGRGFAWGPRRAGGLFFGQPTHSAREAQRIDLQDSGSGAFSARHSDPSLDESASYRILLSVRNQVKYRKDKRINAVLPPSKG